MNQPQTKQKTKRQLFIVSAPSGTGKTSLCTRVAQEFPGLTFSISHTTRPPRAGEQNGKNYYFVTREEFQRRVDQQEMAEWTEIYGNYYGTARETIQRATNSGTDLLFDIDQRGARQLCAIYSDVVTVLVLPPSLEALRNRLVERGTETVASVARRLQLARQEIKEMAWYTYIIINDRFEAAVEQLAAIIHAENCKTNHRHIETLLNDDSLTI